MKRYLLTASHCYYPESGTGDWIGCFETREEAEAAYQQLAHKPDGYYEIVDLNNWIFDKDIETSDEDE